MRSWQKYAILGGVVVALIVAVWLVTRKKESTAKHKIGVILATSGPADYIGKAEKGVLEKLLEDYRAQGIIGDELEVDTNQDSGGKLADAEQIFNRFVEDPKVIAIIGPSTSGESIPLSKLARQKQIPLLSLAASKKTVMLDDSTKDVNPWAFKFAQNDDLAAESLARAMITQGHKSIAFLYSDDGFGKSGAEVFVKAVAASPQLKIVHQASFPPAESTPEPRVAAIPKTADAVLIWGTSPGPALLVKALRTVGQVPIYLSYGNASEAFIESAGPASEGAVVVGSRLILRDEFLDAKSPRDKVITSYRSFWTSRFSGPPSQFGGYARDALEVAIDVLKKKKPSNREEMRAALEESVSGFQGVTGTFTFTRDDHAGLTIDAFEVFKIENGRFVPLRGAK